jgi:hypothetical protein
LRFFPRFKATDCRRSAGFQTCCIADFQIGMVSQLRGVCGFGNPPALAGAASGHHGALVGCSFVENL